MKKIIEYYNQSCRDSEYGWQASCWSSEDDQYGRFVIASSMLPPIDCSVLDIGCGQGDFYNFINQRYKNINYLGIDISEEMIKSAKSKNPNGNFTNIDLNDWSKKADYVFALGTFNLKLEENQSDYIENYIKKCYDLCNKRVCIALTSDLAEEKCPDIYFYKPEQILSIAIKLCSKIILNTASISDEMVLHMIKS